jgi:hypothetical protein
MNVGWLHGNCLAIKNQSISLPYTFTLIHLDENENSEKTVITEKATTRKGCYAIMDGRLEVNRDNGYSFYLVESEQVVNLAIGVLSNQETNAFKYSYCNTTEGIRFTLSKQNSILWEGYYYLGYESEPTCGDNFSQ